MNQDAIDLLPKYVVINSRTRMPGIQVTEENFPTLAVIFDDCLLEIVAGKVLMQGKVDTSVEKQWPLGNWLLFPFQVNAVCISEEDFRKRFVPSPDDPRPLRERFKEIQDGLHHVLDQMLADDELSLETNEQGLLELLTDQISGVDANPEVMKRMAVTAILLYLNGEFNPGQLIAAHNVE